MRLSDVFGKEPSVHNDEARGPLVRCQVQPSKEGRLQWVRGFELSRIFFLNGDLDGRNTTMKQHLGFREEMHQGADLSSNNSIYSNRVVAAGSVILYFPACEMLPYARRSSPREIHRHLSRDPCGYCSTLSHGSLANNDQEEKEYSMPLSTKHITGLSIFFLRLAREL